MALFGLFAFMLGYLAGLRYRVAVVLPLEAAVLAGAFALALSGQMGTGAACGAFALGSVALQVGYALALACPLPVRRPAQRQAVKA